MTDKELLELAAKAAGIEGKIREIQVTYTTETRIGIGKNRWNPLESDADALRLAVKLNLKVMIRLLGAGVCSQDGKVNVSDYGEDPYAATRSAIVRAAAEIGRAM